MSYTLPAVGIVNSTHSIDTIQNGVIQVKVLSPSLLIMYIYAIGWCKD